MFKRLLFLGFVVIFLVGCDAPPERNCKDFKIGAFSFATVIDGKEKKTRFNRSADFEIEYFDGKQDTSSIRWINDCEYVLKKINPKNKAEEKSIHIKILTTTDSSYTFEYKAIGDNRKFKGTAFKTH